jgi:DNA-binding transcriptional LysR family regulator
MDLDLRKLRYFVAVADTLHFGRAADELHIAQPALSRQIRALEQDLGTPLLTRDSHGVALTDAGRQLLSDAGPLLASAHAVRRRVTLAARGSQRLMVGFRAGVAVTPAVRLFAERHPDVLVDMQRIEWDDQATMLGSPARSASVICSRPASRWPAGSTATRGSVYSGVTRRPASSMGSRT